MEKEEKAVTIEELTHKDIGKKISFTCLLGSVKAEFTGTLGGIDRARLTVKDAKFRKSGTDTWAPTQEKNPEIPVEESTVIHVFKPE